jgi:glycosyltransferase involved in cell wall biosynthesis
LKKYPGVEFTVIALCSERPRMIEDMKERDCECVWIKFDTRKRKMGMIKSFFRLYFLFLKLRPDVVNTHLFDDSLPGLLAARLAGVRKRVIRKQDTAFHWFYTPQWVWADRFNNFNATHIIAISHEAERFIIEKEKAPASKLYMIHNGIPFDEFTTQNENIKKQLIEKYKLEGKIVIGTIARMIEWKGYQYIVEAIKILEKSNKNLKFLFVGEGEQRKDLEELVEKYGLGEYIVFTGWIDRQDIASLYGILNIYVHAAIMEPFGFVISEAMANKVPIVATKTGAAADVLEHMKTCYFCENKDPRSIADGISWMLAHSELLKDMGIREEELAREFFGIDQMVDKHMNLYLE